MEKPGRGRLITAALRLLAAQGSGAVTVRAVEQEAGMPHGSVRHHFGGLSDLRSALVRALLEAEAIPDPPEPHGAPSPASLTALVDYWTGDGAPIAVARYEVMLMAIRDPAVRDAFVPARETFVDRVAALGVERSTARTLMAMLDGIVLDALVRGRPADLEPWLAALGRAAAPVGQPGGP